MAAESDITILAKLSHALDASPQAGQRELAVRTDLSLGMMNAVLKRFVKKGWVMANRLSAKKICYMLTPEGIKAVTERTASYMRRTFAAVKEYGTVLNQRIGELKQNGYTAVVLWGESDAAFLLEYVCRIHDMKLLKYPFFDNTDKVFIIISESIDAADLSGSISLYQHAAIFDLLHAQTGETL